MLSGIKTLITPSRSTPAQRTGAPQQRGQGVLAQQDARPRQAGGGTLQRTAQEQNATVGQGMRQGDAPSSSTRGRFRAFMNRPLFRGGNNSPERIPMQPLSRTPAQPQVQSQPYQPLHVNIPAVPDGEWERDTNSALDRVGSENAAPHTIPLPDSRPSSAGSSQRTAAADIPLPDSRPSSAGSSQRTTAADIPLPDSRPSSAGSSQRTTAADIPLPDSRPSSAGSSQRTTAADIPLPDSRPSSAGSSQRTTAADIPLPDSRPSSAGSSQRIAAADIPLPDSRPSSIASSDAGVADVGNQPAPVTLALNDKRNVTVGNMPGKEAQQALIRQTLGHQKMHFQSNTASQDNQKHALLDDSGRLHTLHSSGEALIGVANSKARPDWQRSETPGSVFPRRAAALTDHALTLTPDENHVQVSRRNGPGAAAVTTALPDKAILSQLSGIHQVSGPQGETAFRLHEKKLYQMTHHAKGWVPAKGEHLDTSKNQAQLALHGDNQLYVVHDDRHLHNLSTQQQSPRFDDKISKASIAPDGQALLLLNHASNKAQTVAILPRFDAPSAQLKPLAVEPNTFQLAGFSQTAQHVIAADHKGQLHIASRPDNASSTLRFNSADHRQLTQQLRQQIADVVGDRFHVSDFISGDNNQLHALVKDNMDRQHAIALNLDHPDRAAHSAWNLNDSLVMDYQKGLPKISPTRADVVEMGTFGKLALAEGKVHYFDDVTGNWQPTEVEADKLRVGQDGQAWALKDNQLKRLKVNVSSNKINFDQNTFALHQVKKSVTEDLAMPGLDKNQKTVAASALDDGRYLTLQDNGNLHIHHVDSTSRREKQLTRSLDQAAISQAMNNTQNRIGNEPQENHKPIDMTLGPDNQLFILSDKGRLFSVPSEQWQQGKLDGIREERLPKARVDTTLDDSAAAAPKPTSLHSGQKGTVLVGMDNDHMLARDAGDWHPVSKGLSNALDQAHNQAEENFDRVSAATRDRKLIGTGLTFKREINIFGQTGHDGHKVHTPFRTRLSTFVFRPTLATPRPMKNMGYMIQHAHGGRQGLNPIYELQNDQLMALRHHHQSLKPGPAERPLADKLTQMREKPDAPAWLGEMGDFTTQLAQSANWQAGKLLQHYGQPENAATRQLHALTSGMNPAHTRGDDLAGKLTLLFGRHPATRDNVALNTLTTLRDSGAVLTHQKPTQDMPAGLHRDKHDPMGLTKSRLILDGLTTARLHELSDRVSSAMDLQGEARTTRLNELQQEFRALRDESWGGNPLKQVTSYGFAGNDQLESNYDAIKSMTKAFSKANHSVNVTTRTVMQAEDQSTLARKLEGTVLSMEKGESIAFSRDYGAATTVSGLPGSQVIAGLGGRGNLDRSYNMTLTRGEGNVNVSFGRDGGGSLTAFTGVGYNVLTDVVKQPAHKTPIDGERDLLPSVRVGGVFSGTPLDVKKQNSISFDITEAELPAFIQGLTEGTLDPLTLLNLGLNHNVKHGNVANVSLDANIAALATAGVPLTNKNENDTPATFRVGGGIYSGANILSGTRERSSADKEESNKVSRSNNRLRGLNKANVGGNFALPTGVLVRSDQGRMPMFAGPAASIQLTLDNRTKQSLSVETVNARPLDSAQIDKLMETLSKAFSDPATAGVIARLKDSKPDDEREIGVEEMPRTPRQKLDMLNDHFPLPQHRLHLDNSQQAALRDLDKHTRQQTAAENGGKLLESGEYQTTYANLSKVDSNGIWHQISHLLDGRLNASNATKIRELMSNDHQLQSLIASLQDNVSTDATVTLELKDSVRERLEQRWMTEGNSAEETVAELTNRDNLRLKSIAFTKSQSKSDGFATPAFLLGGSNSASVTMKRNQGKINFSYGADQDKPTQYSLDGRIAKATTELSQALRRGQDHHYVLKG